MNTVIVGDLLLDCDLDGTSTRAAPDSGAPVVDIRSRTERPGGAGLAALLAAGRAGDEVTLVTTMASDAAAARVTERLRAHGVRITAAAASAWSGTPTKTRVRVDGRHIARIDEHCEPSAQPRPTVAMLRAIERADAIVVSDYGRGITRLAAIRDALQRVTCPIVWDPHPLGSSPVPRTTVATPNAAEAAAWAGMEPRVGAAQGDAERGVREDADGAWISACSARLLLRWPTAAVAITMGADGLAVATRREGPAAIARVEATPVPDADPCGAGDCFAVSLCARLGAGDELRAASAAAAAQTAGYLADHELERLVSSSDGTCERKENES